ncbi:MAG: polyhydroxyalkanoic acid system family protein [Candidatus Nealsonbacteria bacterium]|nr:polyhydroxyalkanoic acid system family protein [Candidatus Nealsonbacteria bacterium]
MSKIYLRHETSLLSAKIKEKADNLIEEALGKYKDQVSGLRKEWKGNTLVFLFKVKGFFVSGEVIIEDNLIIVEAKIPLVAAPFKRKIEAKFYEKARELFP